MKLSIIIPTHGRSFGLNRLLDRLAEARNEILAKIEVVVVDDLANLEVSSLLASFFRRLPNLIFVQRANLGGVALSRNLGIRLASGDLITFCDDDDVLNLEWVELLLSLDCCSNSLFYGDWIRVTENRSSAHWEPLRCEFVRPDADGDSLLSKLQVRNQLAIGSFALPSVVAKKVEFNTNLKSHEDWDWLLKVTKETSFKKLGGTACFISIPLASSQSRSSSSRDVWIESFCEIYRANPVNDPIIEATRRSTLAWVRSLAEKDQDFG